MCGGSPPSVRLHGTVELCSLKTTLKAVRLLVTLQDIGLVNFSGWVYFNIPNIVNYFSKVWICKIIIPV